MTTCVALIDVDNNIKCDRKAVSCNLCVGHNRRRLRGKPIDGPLGLYRRGATCHWSGCKKAPKSRFCAAHDSKLRRLRKIHGDLTTEALIAIDVEKQTLCQYFLRRQSEKL